jgi:hypothetical protein
MDNTLNTHEKKRKAACEAAIRNGQKAFYNMGRAVGEIRTSRLYRDTHATADLYFQERFDMTRQRVSQLVFAHHVHSLLKEFGFTTLPNTESQCRPLSRVPEGMTHDNDIISVWSEVVASNERITAKLITNKVDAFLDPNAGTDSSTSESAEDNKASGQSTGAEDSKAGGGAEDKGADNIDKEAELLTALRNAQAKIAYLESALAAEKKAHQNTRSAARFSAPSSKLAKDLFRAGFRAMAQKYHPDHGGDQGTMKELNELKSRLGI